MHHTTKILLCLCLAIGMHNQQVQAFTDKNAQTTSNIIGLVAGGATAYIVFKKMRGNAVPQKPDLEEKRETIDLSDDDIIVVDAQQFAQKHSTQNSFIKSLVASLLCGALVGIATKVGSQWILDRYLVDELTAYVADWMYKDPKEVRYPAHLNEDDVFEYLRKNNPTAHYFSTTSGIFTGFPESYQEEQERNAREERREREQKEREQKERERKERKRKEQEEQEKRERKERKEREEQERKEQEERWERERKKREKHQKSWDEFWKNFFDPNEDDDSDQKYLKALGFADGEKPTNDDIRLRYKKLAMEKHPDKGGSIEEFQRINEAYEKLKPPPQKPGTTSETN